MRPEVPNAFYRVSIKALILNESGDKFAAVLEDNGRWELPGGGMDWGETPQECLAREIREEMGLETTYVAGHPAYYLIGQNMSGNWSLNLVFETRVKDLNFVPSDECREIRFVSPEEIKSMNAFRTVKELGEKFNLANHGSDTEATAS